MPFAQPMAVYALTAQGAGLAASLASELRASLHLPARLAARHPQALCFDSLPSLLRERFHHCPAHIFIAAAGIVVRLIAPLLRSKDRDPAVLVLDPQGRHVISLLSGHLGGANALAHRVAALTQGQAVITTATDNAGAPCIELLALESGLALENLAASRHVNSALAEKRPVPLYDPEGWLQLDTFARRFFSFVDSPEAALVLVTHREHPEAAGKLLLRPPCLCVGIGCRKGASRKSVLAAVAHILSERGLALASIQTFASVEAKSGESGLLGAAATLQRPIHFFSAPALNTVPTPNPSARVASAVGTPSVCEAAALLMAGSDELLIEKTIHSGVPIAVRKGSRT
jgi:cobalt-precorrin 5A hydrolase